MKSENQHSALVQEALRDVPVSSFLAGVLRESGPDALPLQVRCLSSLVLVCFFAFSACVCVFVCACVCVCVCVRVFV
jgi:hypothetical protein